MGFISRIIEWCGEKLRDAGLRAGDADEFRVMTRTCKKHTDKLIDMSTEVRDSVLAKIVTDIAFDAQIITNKLAKDSRLLGLSVFVHNQLPRILELIKVYVSRQSDISEDAMRGKMHTHEILDETLLHLEKIIKMHEVNNPIGINHTFGAIDEVLTSNW
jgi:hypothetical protein